MSDPKYTALFEILDAADQTLQAIAYPQDPGNPRPVAKWFGVEAKEWPLEVVVLAPETDGPDSEEWWSFGPGRKDYTTGLTVIVSTAIPGRTTRQVRDRLFELVAPIDEAFRGTNGKPGIPDVPGCDWWSIVSHQVSVGDPDNQGARGICEIVISVRHHR